jgi:molybdate transport system ATP-binding protein
LKEINHIQTEEQLGGIRVANPPANRKEVGAFITVKDLTVKYRQQVVLSNISFTMNRGEQWLITGKAGIGKSALGKAICGKIYSNGAINVEFSKTSTLKKKVLFVEQWYHFTNTAGVNDLYYQQRYQSSDSEDTITVLEDLKKSFDQTDKAIAEQTNSYLEKLGLFHRIHAPLIQLSSGEQKKLQLIKAFLEETQLIIIDNAFIGLDVDARKNLDAIFTDLAEKGTHLILIADTEEIPSCITHIAELKETHLNVRTKEVYNLQQQPSSPQEASYKKILSGLHAIQKPSFGFSNAVTLNNVSVKYGEKTVLQNIHWKINKGEKWLLQGHNGAGKSTLLSLLTGDNPQAYANEIYLFDKKRGSGETIWDIKKKIGYSSPELHWYFDNNTTCLDTVVSGFYDTTGLYKKPTEAQLSEANNWLSYLHMTEIANKRLKDVSIGQQRMLLLARALVKNPPLIILDEPCQGLDPEQSKQFISIVDALMHNNERTLIYVSHRKDQIPECINHAMMLDSGMQKSISLQNKQQEKQIA